MQPAKASRHPVQVKIFIGYLLTSELKMYLSQNPTWRLSYQANEKELGMTKHKGKEYIGLYLNKSEVPLPEVKAAKEAFKSKIRALSQSIDVDQYPVYHFPVAFIS